MHHRQVLAALAAFCCLSAGGAEAGVVEQMRFGVYQHDTGIVGNHKEPGVDYELETLSSPVKALWFLNSPRIVAGGVWNSAGKTDQLYLGIVGQYRFAHHVFLPQDSFFIEGTIGGDWNTGKIDVVGTPAEAKWKSHGSHLLFRPGFAIGYYFDRRWSVAASLNHISNAGLASRNEGSNDLGVLIGMKL